MSTVDAIRVLHVDDESDFVEMAATFLERADERLAVTTASSASEGLKHLAEHDVDCVVSDHDMDGQSGIELLEIVRETDPNLPFILYTGKGSEEVASDAISAGVTDYLQKEGGADQYTILANRIINAVERYRIERGAEQTETQLETLISNLPGMVYRCRNEPNWPMEIVRGECEELTGYSAAELERGDVVWGDEIVHPEGRSRTWESLQDSLDDGQPIEDTYRIRTKDGTTKWVWERARLVRSGRTEERRLEGFVTDITERKRHEQELHEEREFIEQSLDTLDDIFYFIDADGDFQRWNSTLPELTGYSDEEIGSMNALDFFEGEHREAIGHSIDEILENGSHFTEAEITTADGRQMPHEFRGVRMTDDEGEPTGIIGIARDITERKKRERQLKEKTEELEQLAGQFEKQYRTLFEEAPVMAVITREEDGEPIIEDCNGQFIELIGYDEGTILGNDLAEFYTPESAETLLQGGGYRRSLDGTFTREKRDLLTADGEVVETLLRAVPRRDATGDIVGTVAMYIDITEREAVKRANERLEEFTSVVSHDLRNPLNVANGRLKLAQEECDTEHLDHVEQAHDRMGALIDDLLTLAREGREVTDPQPVDLAELIDGCWATVETDGASLISDIDRAVRADRSRLRQVFENLFRNSVEHGGADVTVTVGELDGGFYIEDDGPGIPVDERDDVFEAGYSNSVEGTGFGLSIVEQVVNAHDWQIRVTDGSDGGARFEITGVGFVVT